MSRLVNDLVQKGYLRNERIIDAFSEIGRFEFLPEELHLQAEANVALPIGYGQIIPEPMLMAMIMEILEPFEGCRILDFVSASGWSTALFAYIAGNNGEVVALEKNRELKKTGAYNVDKYGYIKKGIVKFFLKSEAEDELMDNSFDRILIFNGTEADLIKAKKKLKIGGKMVVSNNSNVIYFERKTEDEFEEEKYSGFSTEPLLVR